VPLRKQNPHVIRPQGLVLKSTFRGVEATSDTSVGAEVLPASKVPPGRRYQEVKIKIKLGCNVTFEMTVSNALALAILSVLL
jgi:hypothetical protein